MAFQDRDIFTDAGKNLKELLLGKKVATFAFVVAFEGEILKFTHVKKLSSDKIRKAIQDNSIAIVCKDSVSITYEFALAHELTKGQQVQNPLIKAMSPANIIHLAEADKWLIIEQLHDYIAVRDFVALRKLQRAFSSIKLGLGENDRLQILSKKIHRFTKGYFSDVVQEKKPITKHLNRSAVIIPREMLSEYKKKKKIRREK